ncbi:MAG: GNAT family N-acetyltransferase [Pirellulaceae bacterium]|nr:GNAT family N-acetyltransferase [Pirellulaceae bacterium]
MYHVERTSDLSSLLAQADLWNDLACGIPFRETSWIAAWWRQFGQGQEAYILVARDQDNAVRGILPLYVRNQSGSSRTLAMIGDSIAYSDYVSVLARPDDGVEVAKSFGQFLANHIGSNDGWDMIDIDGVVEGDQPMTALMRELRDGGSMVHAHSRMNTWFRPREANWDDHLKRFSKTQRRKMRRWSEKVGTVAGLEKHLPESIDEALSSLDALIDLHQRRWNSVGEAGSYASAAFREFIVDCTTDFCSRGRLHLPTLTFQGRPVSSELHFVGGNRRLYCYSSGYDIQQTELEPGRILTVETLHDLYRLDFDGIDYLRGDEPYKKRMSAAPTRVLRVLATAPSLLPRLRHAAWWTGFEMKQWMRRRTGRKLVEVVDLA